MKQYKIVDNILGWFTFLVAAVVYCSTIEPTASFWDCPEFITTGYKMEIGHPPGAPFFMLTANLFTQFVSDPSMVARMVNTMSALLSATTILFLFWSITHLTRRLIIKDWSNMTTSRMIAIEASGLVGALIYTFSDTFWFSAVEGEVYAYSSAFTAIVFWLILKWEDHADEPHSDRWLVLITYMTGLSIGVHLLNLLCIPAIVLVFTYRKFPNVELKGSLIALAISFVLVAAVLYGVVPGIITVGGWFELLFVNVLGCPFNTGEIIYLILLVGTVIWAIYETYTNHHPKLQNVAFLLSVALLGIPFYGFGIKAAVTGAIVLAILWFVLNYKRKGSAGKAVHLVSSRIKNTALLCMLMLMIGYSSYALIVIRSAANPPMDQNSPEDIFTLGSYLSRDQYGDSPLLYGQAYTSEVALDEKDGMCVPRMKTGAPIYSRKEKSSEDEKDSYFIVNTKDRYVYAQNMVFPRMHDRAHAQEYEDWMGGVQGDIVNYDRCGQPVQVKVPSQWDNLKFFFSYQCNFMYWRYFMWNFAGRQNDVQGHGALEKGNWITGFKWFDNWRLGNQDNLPDDLKNNKGHNVFYCLPLILGLIGLFFQAYRGEKGVRQFWVVFFLFFMTGLAIVLYLNQTPSQPRERDYAYAGSFYAFAIWIGLGVAALAAGLEKMLTSKPQLAAAVATIIGVLVPIQMVSQTWDDHDRSGRYTCRDFGANYLNTLPDKGCPIIFSNGDNDTFPLWYNQEVEGTRTDARVCNLSYLQTDWYTDQMRRPAYDSKALPITWSRYFYVDNGKHSFYPIRPEGKAELDELKKQNPKVDPYELSYILDHYVKKAEGGYFPTDSVVVSVNKQAVIESGMYLPMGKDSIPDKMIISLKSLAQNRGGLYRNDVMIYEMLAHADWKRPMYMSVTLGPENYAGLENYLVLEGLAYRITPFNFGQRGVVDADLMYNNMMNRFKYGNVADKNFYLDETVGRMCETHRRMFMMLADALVRRGEKDKALKALKKCKEVLPAYTVPYDDDDSQLAAIWLAAGDKQEAARVAKAVLDYDMQYMRYISSLGQDHVNTYGRSCYFMFSSIIEASDALKKADPKAHKMYEMQIQRMISTPSFQLGMQYYQQQMSAAAQ